MKNIQDEILNSNVSYAKQVFINILLYSLITETTRITDGETVTTSDVTEAVKYYNDVYYYIYKQMNNIIQKICMRPLMVCMNGVAIIIIY